VQGRFEEACERQEASEKLEEAAELGVAQDVGDNVCDLCGEWQHVIL